MIYKAYLKQNVEGCDYTIGCAEIIINIEATTEKEAIEELNNEILENYSHPEAILHIAELYEINKVIEISVNDIYTQRNKLKAKKYQKQKEETEYQKYQELKKKFSS